MFTASDNTSPMVFKQLFACVDEETHRLSTVLWPVKFVRMKSDHQLPVACLQSLWRASLLRQAKQVKPEGPVLDSSESIPRCHNLEVNEQVLVAQRINAT